MNGTQAMSKEIQPLETADARGAIPEKEKRRLQARQAQSIMRMTPWTIILNITVSIILYFISRGFLPGNRLYIWTSINIAASVLILAHWRLVTTSCDTNRCTASYITSIRVQGVLLGVIWASIPVMFYKSAPGDLRTLIAAMTLGAFSLGSFRLAQVPSAAISYISIPAMALSITAYRNMDGYAAPAFSALTIIYATALILIVLMRYQDAMNNARNIAELNRRRNIIKLLLNDFEDNASDWLWEISADGKLTYASSRLEDLTGVSREELTGKTLREILDSGHDGSDWKKFYAAILSGRAITGMVLPATLKDKERWFSMTARPLFDSNGVLQGYRGVASDITGQHLHEQRLREDREKAIAESRAKSNFLAVISHELRTPLNAMVGFSELLVGEAFGPLNDKYKEFSSHIHEGSRQLERLINDILDYTRFERKKIRLSMQDVDLEELADMTLRQMRMDERARGLELKLEAPEDIILVKADLGRLKQVLSNLLVNAIKFTHEGSVTVSIARNGDGGVSVSVADTGIGISPQDMKTIFEPFCQADASLSRRHDGIGLGLSIARSLMQLHGGDLTLQSNPGEGVTATFTLPGERVIHDGDENTLAA